MAHQRMFNLSIALLIGQVQRLLGALRDATAGPGVLKRSKADPDTTCAAKPEAQIQSVETGAPTQGPPPLNSSPSSQILWWKHKGLYLFELPSKNLRNLMLANFTPILAFL